MEHSALERLYALYQRELYLYLLSLCGRRDQAEDLLQETFLKALLSLPEGHANVRAWLYMVARNLYFTARRQEARFVSLEEPPDTGAGEDLLQTLVADERRRALYRALRRLEARKREVLTLQHFGGLSQKEIAAVLRLTPENVRVLAWRGRRELREILEEDGYDIS